MTVNDSKFDALSKYTGTVNDREKQFWTDFTGGGTLPPDYRFEQTEDGSLRLYHVQPEGDVHIGTFSEDGSYFKTSVSTGVGSYHLGGSDSGGVSHTISAMGQNVGFKNEWTTGVDNDKIVWFPTWQGIAVDGGELKYASKLQFTAPVEVLPVGVSYMSTVAVDYDFGLVITEDMAVLGLTIFNKEYYTGKLYNVIYHGVSGSEIYRTELHTDELAVDWSQWQTETFLKYKYPYFARNGDQLRVAIFKEDGTPLKVAPSTQNPAIPWRRLKVSKFTDDYLVGDSESFNFDVKSTTSTQNKNGIVALNNWTTGSMKTITVAPNVDYIKLMPWDSTQSDTEYSEVKLPINASGSAHHTVKYMTNHHVHIYRHKDSGSTPYTWYVQYDGYDHTRALATTASTYELRAGKHTINGNGAISQATVNTSWNIDDYVRVYASITSGTSVNMYLQLNTAGTISAAHIFYNQNQTNINRVLGNITTSSTNFIIDATSTDGEIAFIDTTIHSTSDGSGDWRYKYKGRFTHHNNNNMYWCLEAEYNPKYIV